MLRNELEERIKTIKLEMEQVKCNFSKLEGHLCENKYWLQQLDKDNYPTEDNVLSSN